MELVETLEELFPAGAGVILYLASTMIALLAVPRRGGGDPSGETGKKPVKVCSPQGRG